MKFFAYHRIAVIGPFLLASIALFGMGTWLNSQTPVIGSHQPKSDAPRRALNNDVEEALWWLPERTNSLLFTKGSLPLEIWGDDSKKQELAFRDISLPDAATCSSLGVILNISQELKDYRFACQLARDVFGTDKVKFTIAAAWYASPTNEGDLESCGVVVFSKTGGTQCVNQLEPTALSVRKLDGDRVLELGDKRDPGRMFLAAPRDSILLYSCTLDTMSELLRRFRNKPSHRALPAELPEWSQVEVSSPVWGIRHYDPTVVGRDRTTMAKWDPKGKGIVVFYSDTPARSLVLRYLSASSDADVRFKRMLATWTTFCRHGSNPVMPFRRLSPNTVEFRFMIRKADEPIPRESCDVRGNLERFVTWQLLPLIGVSDRPHSLGD